MSAARPSLSPEIVGRRHACVWRRRVMRLQVGPFGRGPVRDIQIPEAPTANISDDVKLFATTFAAGFLVVSIFIG